jgi:hypothetical protein
MAHLAAGTSENSKHILLVRDTFVMARAVKLFVMDPKQNAVSLVSSPAIRHPALNMQRRMDPIEARMP